MVLDIHPDMLDHWVWSRFLEFGYYEHPPMVALTMKIATLIGGSNEITLKLGSIIFSILILYLCFQVGSVFFNRKAALIFIIILESTPYFSMGSVFWHIDQPYMVFWLAGLYVIGRYLQNLNSNWIFAFGIIAGLGAMSKYIMIHLPIGLLIFCLINKEQRMLLYNWKTYLAAALSLLILAPNIYWNFQHEWVTFNYNFTKGLQGANFGIHFSHFISSQLVLFSLVYSCYFWWLFFRRRIRSSTLFSSTSRGVQSYSFLLITGIVPFIFFSGTSFLGNRSDPHWVNISYFSFFILLAGYIEKMITGGNLKKQFRFFLSANILNYLILGITLIQIHFAPVSLAETDSPSLNKLLGWHDTAEKIERLFDKQNMAIPEYIISREYHLSGALAFYLRNQPIPHSIEKPLRNQWSPVSTVLEIGAFIVCVPKECDGVLRKTSLRFKTSTQYFGNVQVKHFGRMIRELNLFLMADS